MIPKSKLRTRISNTGSPGSDIVCHCFGVTMDMVRDNPQARQFVMEQVKKNAVHVKRKILPVVAV